MRNLPPQDLCPVNLSEHVAIGTTDKIALPETVNTLDPAHASATGCWSALS
ncbi:hypothetical protein GCM10009839_94270 [Catenulispora yoronensis]|uniref:Uncharacterized protein n=1 Tax=Catenulispora yoronensis TaxID=450799 RepID=A0ABN2VPF3_9ACTN